MTDQVATFREQVYAYDNMIRAGIMDGTIMTRMEGELTEMVSSTRNAFILTLTKWAS